jgi:hypothetical protein
MMILLKREWREVPLEERRRLRFEPLSLDFEGDEPGRQKQPASTDLM